MLFSFVSVQRVPADYRCTHLLDKGANGLKIAVVKEGFGRDYSENTGFPSPGMYRIVGV